MNKIRKRNLHYKFKIINRNCWFVLLLILGIGCTLPLVAQDAPKGTGFVWRNLEVIPRNCSFSPDGTQLACASWGREVENIVILDPEDGTVLRSFGKNEFGRRQPELFAWSPDGKQLAVVTNYNPESDSGERGVVYQVADGTVVRTLDLEKASRIGDVAFSADGKRVDVAAIPKVFRWSVANRDSAEVVSLNMDEYGGESVKFVPGEEQLITGREDVLLWDATTGKQLSMVYDNQPEDKGANFATFAFSSNQKWLAGITFDLYLRIWDRETGNIQKVLNLSPDRKVPMGEQHKPSLEFINADLLSVYASAIDKVRLIEASSVSEMFAFEGPKQLPGKVDIAWQGDRFIHTDLRRSPLTLRLLCRGTETCGKDEGLNPSALTMLLPSEAAGHARTKSRCDIWKLEKRYKNDNKLYQRGRNREVSSNMGTSIQKRGQV